jgi:hypothetical protein
MPPTPQKTETRPIRIYPPVPETVIGLESNPVVISHSRPATVIDLAEAREKLNPLVGS